MPQLMFEFLLQRLVVVDVGAFRLWLFRLNGIRLGNLGRSFRNLCFRGIQFLLQRRHLRPKITCIFFGVGKLHFETLDFLNGRFCFLLVGLNFFL